MDSDPNAFWAGAGSTGAPLPSLSRGKVRLLQAGATFKVGATPWEVIWTPGPAAGHVRLFDRRSGVLIAGDLFEESKALVGFSWVDDDPFGSYLRSLARIRCLPIRLALPGHGEPVTDVRVATERIAARMRSRLNEVAGMLDRGATTEGGRQPAVPPVADAA